MNLFGDNINVCAIVGPNGSGKSSLLDMLYRLANNFGYLLYRDIYMPEAENPHYIADLYVTLTFSYGETIYTLVSAGNSMELRVGSTQNNNVLPIGTFDPNYRAKRRVKVKGHYETYLSQSYDEYLSKLASNFFYTIVTNYSIQSLNYQDYEGEGNWIQNLFHKNDGYIHPIVLNPFRDEQGINIENESELTKYRLSAILLHAQMPNHKYHFIDGYQLHHIQYHLDPSKYYNKFVKTGKNFQQMK